MKWWLYNRFRYLDSKYVTGTSMTNRITIRAHQKASVFLTSYVNMYGHVYFNAAHVEQRMTRGQEYEFEWPASGAEDPVIGINDADLLTSLGDLSPLMVELIDVSGAPHITRLKVGDGAEDYANYSLNSITLGNNVLLQTLDCRNCPNLTMAPDISGCTNIGEVYFEGSGITGLKLPDGGVLKTLHLPGTLVNLTVRNQPQLADFQIPGFGQITTLSLENAGVLDGMALEILNQLPANSRVRLIGLSAEMSMAALSEFAALLDTMRGLDESGNNTELAQVSGAVYIGEITPADYMAILQIQSRYPSLSVVYRSLVPYVVRFCNYDGTVLQTVNVETYGGAAIYTGETPVKPNASVMEDWEFTGWSPEPVDVTGDMDCYAQFRNRASLSRALLQRTISGYYTNHRVTAVGIYAFEGCSQITGLDFALVTRINAFAFYCCSKLVTLVLRTDSVCTLSSTSAFTSTPIASGSGYIYVPAELLESYKAAANWSTYADQIRAIEDYPDICGGE